MSKSAPVKHKGPAAYVREGPGVRGGRYWVLTSDLFGVNTTDHSPAPPLSGIRSGQVR